MLLYLGLPSGKINNLIENPLEDNEIMSVIMLYSMADFVCTIRDYVCITSIISKIPIQNFAAYICVKCIKKKKQEKETRNVKNKCNNFKKTNICACSLIC